MIPQGKQVITGNQAVAYAVMLSKPDLIPAYPITPQTAIMEHLASFCAQGGGPRFTNMESEHSALAYAIAASRAGCRVFTATAFQGLLYMHEELQRASRERVPVVLVNVNRGIAMPWTIHPDFNDSMSQRDTGWIQLYCESVQDVLDTVISAFRIAETTSLPVMVCEEGFFLSHTSEIADIPDQAMVDAFLPAYQPRWRLDPDNPHVFGAMAPAEVYSKMQMQLHRDLEKSIRVIEDTSQKFSRSFGRSRSGPIELVNWDNPKIVFVTIGSVTGSARELVERMDNVGLIKIHSFRPFPASLFKTALCGVEKVIVVDRALSFGSGGILAGEIRGVTSHLDPPPHIFSFVGGFGGADITVATLEWMLKFVKKHERSPHDTIPISCEVR